jgi:hypothetical protein
MSADVKSVSHSLNTEDNTLDSKVKKLIFLWFGIMGFICFVFFLGKNLIFFGIEIKVFILLFFPL